MDNLRHFRSKYGYDKGKPSTKDERFKQQKAQSDWDWQTREAVRRQEERERRKREEEERRRREKINTNVEALNVLENSRGELSSYGIDSPGGTQTYKNTQSKKDERTINTMSLNQKQPARNNNNDRISPFTGFNKDLRNDINKRIEEQKFAGMNEKEIQESLIPQEDNEVQKRLDAIADKIKPGKENFLYNIKEGWHEREIQNMLSKEYVRKMNGLSNNVDIIEDFLEENPDLMQYTTGDENVLEKFWKGGVRFIGSGTRLQFDSYKESAQDPMSYIWGGAILAASLMAAPVTGGASLAAAPLAASSPLLVSQMPLITKTFASLKPLAAVSFGMKHGALKNMTDLEAGSAYNEYLQEGIDHRIAAPMASTVGAFNGVVEYMQIDSALSAIPGLSDLVNNGAKMAQKELVKEVTKVITNYGIDLGANALEEMVQGGATELGLGLSRYLQDAPDPSTIGGLQALGKTMASKDFKNVLLEEGYGALQSMWLSPIVSSAGRVTVNKSMQGMANTLDQSKITNHLHLEQQMDQKKMKSDMDYILEKGGATDQAIRIVNETRDTNVIGFLMSEKQVLEDILQREDITNQDKKKISEKLNEIDTVIGKVMYETKEENANVDYKATNKIDVEAEIVSEGFLDNNELYSENLTNYNIELYQLAEKHNALETIKEELNKATNKAEIIEKVKKMFPRKQRQPLNLMSIVNSVDMVQNETKAQIVMNNLHNLSEVHNNQTENVDMDENLVDSMIEQEENLISEEIEKTNPLESDLKEEVEGINTITLEEDESLGEVTTEPMDGDLEDAISKDVKVEENIENRQEIEEKSNLKDIINEVPMAEAEFKASDIKVVPIDKINVDPDRFQFRYDRGNAGGATKKLAGTEYNPLLAGTILLWEDEHNDLYVVNGHHRVDLAKNSGVNEMDARILSHINHTADEARALGAMVNIAEDNATSIDVAKLIRDTGVTESDFNEVGIRANSKIAKDGMALANLNGWIFTQVATRAIPIERAVIIGRELAGNADGQNQIISAIGKIESKGQSITNDVLTELIAEVKGTAREEYKETTLFGEETLTKNYSLERAELVSYVKRQLKDRVSLLKNVSKNKNAAILQELGNNIAIDDNVKEMNTADQALWILDATLNYKGTKVNELFNSLAKEYSSIDPMNRNKVKKQALDQLITLMEGGQLLDEAVNQEIKKEGIKDSILNVGPDGEGRQQSFGISEEGLEKQVNLFGTETVNQLKEKPKARIVADENVKGNISYKATSPIAEAISNNPIFNGLTIKYSDESGKVEMMSKEDLNRHGYGHLQEQGEKYIYGFYNDGDRTITLNQEATRDTILEEAIHDIQFRLQEIDPELNEVVELWEQEVREKAEKEGIAIPEGYELLAQSLVYTEFGYASTNEYVADLIAVDDEIVDKFKVLLGEEIAEKGFGFIDSEIAKKDRILNVEKVKSDIKSSVESGDMDTYAHEDNGNYAIAHKEGDGYQVSYFNEELGHVVDMDFDTSEEVADKLIKDEIYQLKQSIPYMQSGKYDRSVADELYKRLYLQRGEGENTDTKTTGTNVSIKIDGSDVRKIREAINEGNFTSEDYKVIVKNNDNIYGHDKIVLEKLVKDAEKKGLHKPNREVTLKEFLYRFYDVEIGDNNKLSDTDIEKHWLYSIDRAVDKKGYLEEAIKEGWTGEYLSELASREKGMDNIKNRLKAQHKYFQDKTETYRHRGLQYQLKEGVLNEEDSTLWRFPKHRGELTLEKIERYLKDPRGVSSFNRVVDKFESPEVLKERLFWHGTGSYVANNRLKAGFRVPEDQRGGGYGEIQHTISLSKSKKVASNFSNTSNSVTIYPVVIQEGAKIINRPDISDAIELEDELLDLWEDKVDAIAIGDWESDFNEQELVVLNPGILSTVGKSETHSVHKLKVEEPTMEEITTMWKNSKEIAAEQRAKFKERMEKRNLQLKAATDTPEFKNWFKDSKVVDESGEPLVVYHGTNAVFDNFNPNLKGYYFTDDNDHEFIQYTNNTIEAYLSIQNPYYAKNRYEAESAVYTDFTQTLKQQGYDGLIYEGGQDADYPGENPKQVVAFNPTQIKSIYNNGMFSEYDPNINYQLKESRNNIKQYGLEFGDKEYNDFYVGDKVINTLYTTEEENNMKGLVVNENIKNKDILDLIYKDAVLGGYDYLKLGNQEPIILSRNIIEDVFMKEGSLFQLKEEGNNGDLLAMHNISKNKLKNAIKLGGFPMPSIAVAKKDLQYTDFGNITLLFDKDTIDPRASKLNKVYSGDAYTSVFPNVYYKVNSNVARRLSDMVHDKLSPELRDEFASSLDEHNINYKLERRGSFEEAYKDDVGLMIAYLNEKGIPFETATTEKQYGGWDYELLDKFVERFPVLYDEKYIDMNVANEIAPELTDVINDFYKEKYPDFTLFKEALEFGQIDRLARDVYEYVTDENRTVIDRSETEQSIKNSINEDDFSNWLGEISEGIIEKTGFRNNKDMFTPSGNRRKWESLHEELTLDNVVRAMKKEPEQAATGSSGIGQFMAVNSQEFKSIQHIRDSIDMLVDLDNEEFKELKDDYSNRLFDIANKIKNPRASNGFIALDNATDILIEAIRDNKTKLSIMKALQAYESDGYITLSNFSENELFDLVDDVQEMPTQYFEAKPKRAVRFNEVQAALIDTSRLEGFGEELEEIKDMLSSVGVKLVETYTSRYEHDRQRAMDSILRQNDVSFQLKDTNSKEFKEWFKDSKAVDDKGNPMMLYHGSPNKFSEFRANDAPGWGKGIYFTDVKDSADEFSYDRDGNKHEPYRVYVSMENPFTKDIRLSYDDIEGTIAYKNEIKGLTEDDFFPDAKELFYEDGNFANKVIRELGYDGIMMAGSNGIDGYEVVVFEPTQIKSVDNRGTWDVNDPNIYYQMKEEKVDMNEMSWGQTIKDADITSKVLKDLLTSTKFMYEVRHNQDTILEAAKLIDTKGEGWVEARLLSDLENNDTLFAASQILTYKFMESGETDRAMPLIYKTGEKAKTIGQAIQILSAWGKQTPEGMLRTTASDFSKLMTEADKKSIRDKTQTLKEEFNRINKEAISSIDFIDSVKKIQDMTTDEIVTRDIMKTDLGKQLLDKYDLDTILKTVKGEETTVEQADIEDLLSFEREKTKIDDNMTTNIVDTINKHYLEGKGDLRDKLMDLGLNEFEVDTLELYAKQQLKEATKDSKSNIIKDTLKKDKHERQGLDEKILEASLDNSMDDNKIKALIAEKEGMPVLNDELIEYIYTQGQYINSLEEGSRERDVATAKLKAEIANHLPTSVWSKIGTIQTMAHLLNVRTTLRNLIGNELFAKVDTIVQNYLGSSIDKIASLKTKQRTTIHRNIFKLFKTQYQGYYHGGKLGLEDALLGINTSEESSKYGLRKERTFTGGPLGALETVLNVTMRATDQAAQTAAYFDSIEEQMMIAGVDKPTEQMIDNALVLGLYRTFNDETALSRAFGKGRKGLNDFSSYFTGQTEFGLGDLVLKYPSTPANILARAMDYSPVGVITTMLQLYKDTSGDPYLRQKMAVQGASRAIAGSAMIGAGVLLAKLGVVTGGDPEEDKDIYQMKKQAGLRDYGINTTALMRNLTSGFKDPRAGELRSGDNIVSYDWVEPMAIPIAIGADTASGGDALSVMDTVLRATTTGMQALTDQPLLTGLTRLFGYGDPVSGATGAILDMPASFTPTLLSHVANFVDGDAKDFYTNYSKSRRAYNAVLNKVPGAKGQLPDRYSLMGEKIRYYPEDIGMISKLMRSIISPAFYGDYAPTKEEQLIFDLYDSTGRTDHVPKKPQRTYTFNKEKFTLTPEEHETMSKWIGKELTSRIRYADEHYMRAWDDESKVDEIKWIIGELSKEARERVAEMKGVNLDDEE